MRPEHPSDNVGSMNLGDYCFAARKKLFQFHARILELIKKPSEVTVGSSKVDLAVQAKEQPHSQFGAPRNGAPESDEDWLVMIWW